MARLYECRVILEDCNYFFKILKTAYQSIRCNACFEQKNLFRCRGCKAAYYCSEACQERDAGSGHALECGSACFKYCRTSWAKKEQVPLFRLYASIRVDPSLQQRQYRLADGSEMCFNDLPSNYPVGSMCPKAHGFCTDLVRKLKKEDPGVTIAEFVRLYGVFITNVLPIRDNDVIIGQGLFVLRPTTEASQVPMVMMIEGRFQILAMMPIPAVAPPLIRYVQRLYGTQPSLREQIEKQNLFTNMWCAQQTNPSWEHIDYARISELSAFLYTTMSDFRSDPTVLNINEFQAKYSQLVSLLRRASSCVFDQSVTIHMAHHAVFAENLQIDLQEVVRLRVRALHHLEASFGQDSWLYCHMEPCLREVHL